MDALVFRLPILLDQVGHAVDVGLVTRHGTAEQVDAARVELASVGGAITTTRDAVDSGLTTAFDKTASVALVQNKPVVAAAIEAGQRRAGRGAGGGAARRSGRGRGP